MSSISNLPLPSIALVLTTDHVLIPRRPSVIKVAPSTPCPTTAHAPDTDMMQTIRSRDHESTARADVWQAHEHHSRHVLFVEGHAPTEMELAESMYEEPLIEGRSIVIRRVVKNKLSNIVFSLRRILGVEIPHTCFSKISRH